MVEINSIKDNLLPTPTRFAIRWEIVYLGFLSITSFQCYIYIFHAYN